MGWPVFSVVMPVHDAAATLEAAIASVQAQTWQDFEIIVIDDGSRDASAVIAESLAAEDHRIRVVRQANAGVATARNRGVGMANGSFIAFLDSDDTWSPDKLARHFALHDRVGPPDASFARIAFLPDGTDRQQGLVESTVPQGDLSLSDVLAENPVCTMSNLVVRRSAFLASGGFKAGLDHAEDQEWLARFVASGRRVLGIDARLVTYRTSSNGLSADLLRMYSGWRGFVEGYAGAVDLKSADSLYCRYLARRALRLPGSRNTAFEFCRRGLNASVSAFLSQPRRGGLTLAGALASLVLPVSLRVRIFA